MTDLELRPLTGDEWPAAARALFVAFGEPVLEADIERGRAEFEPDRSLGAFAGTDLVGTTWLLSATFELPGSPRPAAAVSGVGVSPVHRRRGVLNALMTRQLRDVYEAGVEAVAALWASEGGIYGRYGYGSAAPYLDLELERARAAFHRPVDPTIELRLAEPTADLLRPMYDAARVGRPGLIARTDRFWSARLLDPPEHRKGATAWTAVLAGPAGGAPDGYAVYRTRPAGGGHGPRGAVEVLELVATTTAAGAELWRYVTSQDLMGRTEARVPLDTPLPHLLADPRAAQLSVRDGLWIRLVDLPRALGERSYAAPVGVTLEVVDDLCPWNAGRWRLDASPDGASCVRTDRPADLTLGAAGLGTVHLGGPTLRSLAAAGRVDETRPGVLAAASRAFAGDVAPFCAEVF